MSRQPDLFDPAPYKVTRLNLKGPDMKVSDVFQSKYLKCADLDGAEMLVVIEKVDLVTFKERDGRDKIQPLLFFQNVEKPFGCNITNARTIEHLLGTDEMDDWIGKEIVLYPSVTTASDGKPVDCIRIRGPIKKAVPQRPPIRTPNGPRIPDDPRVTSGRGRSSGNFVVDPPVDDIPPWEPDR